MKVNLKQFKYKLLKKFRQQPYKVSTQLNQPVYLNIKLSKVLKNWFNNMVIK